MRASDRRGSTTSQQLQSCTKGEDFTEPFTCAFGGCQGVVPLWETPMYSEYFGVVMYLAANFSNLSSVSAFSVRACVDR